MAIANACAAFLNGRLPSPTVLFAALLAWLCIGWMAYDWYRLRHIPGPWSNALSRFWLLRVNYRGTFHFALKDLSDKYGDLVRVGPNELFTTDIDVIRRMSAPKSAYTRGPWYATFRFMPGIDHSFSLRDEASHHALKARIAPAYAGSNLMESRVDAQLARLTRLIDANFLSAPADFRPVDFAVLSHYFAMDVIGDMTYGRAFGFLDDGEDVFGYLKWNEHYFPPMMTAATLPWVSSIVQHPALQGLLPKETDKVGLGRFIATAKQVVQRRYTSGGDEKKRDMMGMFFAQGVTEDQAASEAVLQVVAGTDSVATTIRMTLLFILSTPAVFAKLRAELDEARTEGRISSPVRDAEARQALPYLQAVVREGLRIFPGATAPVYKTVPPGGDVIAGYKIPGGTQIGHNVWGISRSKRYWGEDADLFRPERWLEADAASLERMNTLFEIQFGYGKYKCLGRPLVFMEMNKTIPELLLRYDISVVNPPYPVHMVGAGFWLMTDLWLRFSNREGGSGSAGLALGQIRTY